MRIITLIILLVTLSSAIIPCHVMPHEHVSECHHEHHQNHHDSDSDDNDSDEDHPCSPFCMHHSSFFTVKSDENLSLSLLFSGITQPYLFSYKSLQSELHSGSFWHPPKG